MFKDRDKYVTGEHRFRKGYAKSNPRKMVRLWAEKEMRNLKRLNEGGIRSPKPLEVRENVLVMDYLGDAEGWPSPRLKDAKLSEDQVQPLYYELLTSMRIMYRHCRLVHADLSEYNILVHDDHLYIIDVSQSVEHDHPSAYDFLRSDIKNVEDFFSKLGANTIGMRALFDFIVSDMHIGRGDRLALNEVEETSIMIERLDFLSKQQDTEADAVWFQSFIPRKLTDVQDIDGDISKRNAGESLVYDSIMPQKAVEPALTPEPHDTSSSKQAALEIVGDDGSSADSGDDSDDSRKSESKGPRGHRHEDKDAKRVCTSVLSVCAIESVRNAKRLQKKKPEKKERQRCPRV